ncbi:hypothetical protein [Heyndrickxia camelliae]|uniref:hypothetical protein n=1 Tax=Heyndrickxia camelliae TaxID=1707093 RepID=UPI001F4773A8|nr:hypothetical protein [Heyndrickxia camelliae]
MKTIQVPKSNLLKNFLKMEHGSVFVHLERSQKPDSIFVVNTKRLEEGKELNQRLQTKVMAIESML